METREFAIYFILTFCKELYKLHSNVRENSRKKYANLF